MEIVVRPATTADRPWLRGYMRAQWGSEEMVDRTRVMRPAENPAFIAESGGEAVGVLTYDLRDGACEVITLNSLRERQGVGTALLRAVLAEARARACRRLWLLTTNDNLNALGFYQKLGLRLVALYPGAVERARQLKPEIPAVGENGIPLRDELELEIDLGG